MSIREALYLTTLAMMTLRKPLPPNGSQYAFGGIAVLGLIIGVVIFWWSKKARSRVQK
jgi:hypothetical protein